MVNEYGTQKRLNLRVAQISKPLASGAKVVKAGNRVVLDAAGSYIQSKSTGDITPLRIEQDVFVFDVWVVPGGEKTIEDTLGHELAPFEGHAPATAQGSSGQPQPHSAGREGASQSGFPRRVQWP